MKHFKTVEVTYTTKRHVKTTCDLCGADTDHEDEHDENFDYVVIKRNSGYHYNGKGEGDIREINMCPNCFENKLVPWVVGQGSLIHEEEWSY